MREKICSTELCNNTKKKGLEPMLRKNNNKSINKEEKNKGKKHTYKWSTLKKNKEHKHWRTEITARCYSISAHRLRQSLTSPQSTAIEASHARYHKIKQIKNKGLQKNNSITRSQESRKDILRCVMHQQGK